ncbi:MAG: putative LPS-assembly lipoprotein LptE [Pseudomonadota bacterium]|jgi:LPS-assembly lipoprotein
MSLSDLRRRRLVLAGAAGVATLAGCGFQLRGAAPLAFRSIALTGFAPRSPLALELTDALARNVVVESLPARAELVLQALTDLRERAVVATTAAAQVREVQLRLRLRWRTHTPVGREVTPAAELALSRDMSYSESVALAKQHEEADLYREMQTDIVAQVLRRLAAIRL